MTESPTIQVVPVWIRPAQAEMTHGIKRSLLYQWIKEGAVESALIQKQGNAKGIRLVNSASLDALIRSHVQK